MTNCCSGRRSSPCAGQGWKTKAQEAGGARPAERVCTWAARCTGHSLPSPLLPQSPVCTTSRCWLLPKLSEAPPCEEEARAWRRSSPGPALSTGQQPQMQRAGDLTRQAGLQSHGWEVGAPDQSIIFLGPHIPKCAKSSALTAHRGAWTCRTPLTHVDTPLASSGSGALICQALPASSSSAGRCPKHQQ